jgi:FdhD protein
LTKPAGRRWSIRIYLFEAVAKGEPKDAYDRGDAQVRLHRSFETFMSDGMKSAISARFNQVSPDGAAQPVTRALAAEVPVAVEFNGLGYAVMMMSPADMEDFAQGFARAERLIDAPADILGSEWHETGQGIVLRVTLIAERLDRVAERVRHRVSESSCGLCGIENLEAALRPLPHVTEASAASPQAIFAALASLSNHQPLSAETGAVHAAALCGADGTIRMVREDVGRHNAFDKLIGAMARTGQGWDGGFALLTARCSYELVEKAALAGCPLLATISAPTALAVARAEQAGLRLVTLARRDSYLENEAS